MAHSAALIFDECRTMCFAHLQVFDLLGTPFQCIEACMFVHREQLVYSLQSFFIKICMFDNNFLILQCF